MGGRDQRLAGRASRPIGADVLPGSTPHAGLGTPTGIGQFRVPVTLDREKSSPRQQPTGAHCVRVRRRRLAGGADDHDRPFRFVPGAKVRRRRAHRPVCAVSRPGPRRTGHAEPLQRLRGLLKIQLASSRVRALPADHGGLPLLPGVHAVRSGDSRAVALTAKCPAETSPSQATRRTWSHNVDDAIAIASRHDISPPTTAYWPKHALRSASPCPLMQYPEGVS